MPSKDTEKKTLSVTTWRSTPGLLALLDAVHRLEGHNSRNDYMLVVLEEAALAACEKHGVDPKKIVPLKVAA